jgi:catechol 2,3-dioxygenase-like lactoylglutathione lyase family enzyme
MKLGAFTVSLSVKNLETSKDFYEKLGFTAFAGDLTNNYLIMKNGNALVGLFQGMFEDNILTFNPGWDESANPINDFDDVRAIHQDLVSKGIKLEREPEAGSKGPGSIVLIDPDGNPVLIDQHV